MCFGAVLRRPKLRSSDGEPPENMTTMCKLSGLKRFMGPQMFRRKRKTGNINRRRNVEDENTMMDSLSNNGSDVSAEGSGHGITEQVAAQLAENESDRTGSLSRGEHEEVIDGDFTAATSSAGVLEPAGVIVDNGETPRFNENEGTEYIQVYSSSGREARTSEARYVVHIIVDSTARLSGRQDCSANNKRVSCDETRRPSSMEMGVSSSARPVRKQELAAVSEGESKVQKQRKGDEVMEPNFTKPLERRQRGGVSSSDGLRGQEHEVRKLEQNEWDEYDSDEAVYYRLDTARTKTLLDTGYQNLPATHPIECRAYENVDGALGSTVRDCCVNEKVTIVGTVLNYIKVKVSASSSPVKTLTESKHTNYTDIDVLRTTTLLEMTEQDKTRLSRIKKN